MALTTLPLTKGPVLSFGDRLELGIATQEKVLNALGYIPVINILAGSLKFSLATTQIIGVGITASFNEITHLFKRIFYNELIPESDENFYRVMQDRLKKHVIRACQSLGRSAAMAIPFANMIFYKVDSRRYKLKDIESEADLKYYPAERMVLQYRVKENGELVNDLKTKYFDTIGIGKFDIFEHYLSGIGDAFNCIALIPNVNVISGCLHILFGVAHLITSLSVGAIFKIGEAFSFNPVRSGKMRHIGNRLIGQGLPALKHILRGAFEVSYIINYLFVMVMNFSPFSYKGHLKIRKYILNAQGFIPDHRIRTGSEHKFLRNIENFMFQTEMNILNPLGKIPLVSFLSGTVRVIMGIVQSIFGLILNLSLYVAKQFVLSPGTYRVIDLLHEDLKDQYYHGILNIGRGASEIIPLVGMLYEEHDKTRRCKPQVNSSYRYEILRNQGIKF